MQQSVLTDTSGKVFKRGDTIAFEKLISLFDAYEAYFGVVVDDNDVYLYQCVCFSSKYINASGVLGNV